MVAGVPLVILLGTLALTVATRRPRVLATAGVAVVGALAAVALRGKLSADLGVSLPPAMAAFAAVGALAGATFPWAFPFAAAALPGALAAPELPARRAGRSSAPRWEASSPGSSASRWRGCSSRPSRRSRQACCSASGSSGLPATPPSRGAGGQARRVAGFALVSGIAGAALQLSWPYVSGGPRSSKSGISALRKGAAGR